MKIDLRVVFLLLFHALGIPGAFSQPEPCLRVSAAGGAVENMNCSSGSLTSTPYALPANVSSATFRLSDNPATLDPTNPLARYKAFWIFGDGNFAEYPHSDMPGDLATYTQPYSFHTRGDFTTVVTLAEKKSDKDPPGIQRRSISVPNDPAPDSGTPFKLMLQNNSKTLDIFNNELMRPRHHTAFAISAPAISSTTAIFFFYNARKGAGELATPDPSLQTLDASNVILPNYFTQVGGFSNNPSVTTVKQGLVSNIAAETFMFSVQAQNLLGAQFSNYVMVEITNNDQVFSGLPKGFEEIRFFPILKSVLENGTLPTTRFASIVVGRQQPSDNLSSFFTSLRVQNLKSQLLQLFPGSDINNTFIVNSVPNTDGGLTNVYATGADIKDVQMVGSIDPNMLQVKEICPLGGGKYKVKLYLEVCNKGYLSESNVGVRIIDKDKLFDSGLTFEGSVPTTPSTVTDQPAGSGHEWGFTWNTFFGEVHMPGATVDPSDVQDPCQNLHFWVDAKDWAGVQRLVAGTALEVCVTFPNAAGAPAECHLNLPLDSTAVSIDNGFNCGGSSPKPTSTCQCDIVCMVLLFVAVLLAFLWYWKNNLQS